MYMKPGDKEQNTLTLYSSASFAFYFLVPYTLSQTSAMNLFNTEMLYS